MRCRRGRAKASAIRTTIAFMAVIAPALAACGAPWHSVDLTIADWVVATVDDESSPTGYSAVLRLQPFTSGDFNATLDTTCLSIPGDFTADTDTDQIGFRFEATQQPQCSGSQRDFHDALVRAINAVDHWSVLDSASVELLGRARIILIRQAPSANGSGTAP